MSSAPHEQGHISSLPRASFAELSHRLAHDGDVRLAMLAAWASDVHALEELLWENGLDGAPDPAAELAAVGESVAASVEALGASLEDRAMTPREVVEATRRAMVGTFDESVHDMLHERFDDLDHLDACDHSAPTADPSIAGRPLGQTARDLIVELQGVAADCQAVARVMAEEGELELARRSARQADAAAFEAYLVAAATRSGDTGLATVDLRWELVASGPPVVSPGHADGWQIRLLSAVGTAEQDALLRMLGGTR